MKHVSVSVVHALVEQVCECATRCRQALLLLLTLNSWWGGTTISFLFTAIFEINVLDLRVRDKFAKNAGHTFGGACG